MNAFKIENKKNSPLRLDDSNDRGVYIIFLGFFKKIYFSHLDIYRHPLLIVILQSHPASFDGIGLTVPHLELEIKRKLSCSCRLISL